MVSFVNILSNLPILVGTSLVNFLTKVVSAFLLMVACSGVTSSTALTNDEILNVTIDSAKLLELDVESSVVQIGNPAIADVTVNTPKSIFVMGLLIGETNLMVLDKSGNVILDANIIVTPKPMRQVTVHRGSGSIQTLSCYPRCYGTNSPEEPSTSTGTASTSSITASGTQ